MDRLAIQIAKTSERHRHEMSQRGVLEILAGLALDIANPDDPDLQGQVLVKWTGKKLNIRRADDACLNPNEEKP
jgi:hypothetical protein